MVTLDDIRQSFESGSNALQLRKPTAVVVVTLLDDETGPQVLFEVRASHLKRQPGEVCLPGGKIESNECPREAALREMREELKVTDRQIDVLGSLGQTAGPGGFWVNVLVAVVRDYAGAFDSDEVERTFTLPLRWFMENEPEVHEFEYEPAPPEDFPWDLVPGGKEYHFHRAADRIPFYRETDPLIWGFTARIMQAFASCLRDSTT